LTSLELMQFAPLTYCSIECKSTEATILLVTTMIPKVLEQMKSTITSDLMFLKALFMFETWALLLFIKFLLLSLLIGMMTCLYNGSFVVMLI